MLDIRLLGTPRLIAGGKPLEVDTRKAIALLAYLAIEESAARDTVATLLWAESSSEKARATLRRTLSSLRTGAGTGAIEADRSQIALTGEYRSDVAEFERLIDSTTDHDHAASDVCPDCIPPLTRAVDLYRGDFLAGFSVRDAPDFEDWARVVAEGLKIKAGGAFHRLAMARAAAGDYPGAIDAVNRWIELDELHEPAHRLLMLLNAWAGDRPGAIEAYREFVAVLDRELGVVPLEETTELYGAILDEDLPPAPGKRRSVKATLAPKKRLSLLNRAQELAALRLALARSEKAGTVISVTGASWMGKTRLIEEALSEVGADTVVLSARAFRLEQTLPYGVVAQLLQDAAPVIARIQDSIPAWALAVAARINPDLITDGPPEGDTGEELRLFEAVHTLIESISSHLRVIVTIDDGQWIDVASASLVGYLARRLPAMSNVALLMASRSGEPMGDAVEALLEVADSAITLDPLDPEAIQDRVDRKEEAQRVVALAGGIPLLVMEELTNPGVDTPEINRYLDAQLDRLSDLAQQVLAAAAVVTGIRDAQVLKETSGRSEEEIVEAVEELLRAGLIREESDGTGLSFALDRLEAIVYQNTSLIRRRLLHQRAADALRARPRSDTDPRLAAAVASQLRGAGSEEAAAWYHLAGDLARDIFANHEAADFYETAIALGASNVDELSLSLGELAMRAGEYSAAAEHLTAAAGLAEGDALATIELRLGETQRMLGRFDVAEQHFMRSHELKPDSAQLYCSWALLHHRQSKPKQALAMARRAVDISESLDDPMTQSRALNILAITDIDAGEGMDHVDGAIELAGDDDVARMSALNTKARLLAGIGNPEAAIRLINEAIDLAARTGFRHREAVLRNHLADLQHEAGRPEAARAALTDAVALFADIDAGAWQPEVWLLTDW